MLLDLGKLWTHLGRSARIMVGIPDYDAYVAHMQRAHPQQAIMTYAEFFRDRQDARYGGRRSPGRCC